MHPLGIFKYVHIQIITLHHEVRKIPKTGLKDVGVEHVLEKYRGGNVTLWKASEMAGLSIWEMMELIKKEGAIAPYTLKDVKEDIRAVFEDLDQHKMKTVAVSNSTPLIYLAKIGKITLLEEIFEKMYIPEEVFREVIVKGREFDKEKVLLLEQLIEEGFIKVRGAVEQIEGTETLHKGEIAAFSVAKGQKIKTLLFDDRVGLEVAGVLDAGVSDFHPVKKTAVLYASRWQRQRLRVGLQPIRTTTVLLKFYRNGIIDYENFCDSISMLSEEGYFVKAESYKELIKRARELK